MAKKDQLLQVKIADPFGLALRTIAEKKTVTPAELLRRAAYAMVRLDAAGGEVPLDMDIVQQRVAMPEPDKIFTAVAEEQARYGAERRVERPIGHVRTDRHRLVTYSDDNFTAICGHPAKELLGKRISAVLHGPATEPEVVRAMRLAMAASVPFEGVITNYDAAGQTYHAHVRIVPTPEGFEGMSQRLD